MSDLSTENVMESLSAMESRLDLMQERIEALAVVLESQMVTTKAVISEETVKSKDVCGDCGLYKSPGHSDIGLCAVESKVVSSEDGACDRFCDVSEYRDIPLYEGVPVMWKHNNNLKETWKLGWYIQGDGPNNVKVFGGCKYRASLIVPFNYFNPESL